MIIELKDIAISFAGKQVLDGLNLQITSPGLYALLAENGSGKSTLLSILIGSLAADSGTGSILGEGLNNSTRQNARYIGYVSELVQYDVPMPMKKFIKEYSQLFPNWSQETFDKLTRARNFNLDNRFQNYSRGQKMQWALNIALSIRPKLIMIDEVTSVLDIYARKMYMKELEEYVAGGGTVLLTTNVINEVQHVATDLLFLQDGKIKINEKIENIPKQFIKLRAIPGSNHPILSHPRCVWAGVNSDRSISYIIPTELQGKIDIPADLIDRRQILLDDLFVYYFNFNNTGSA
jgi:ABC-2 type transport system ATP-binding protein